MNHHSKLTRSLWAPQSGTHKLLVKSYTKTGSWDHDNSSVTQNPRHNLANDTEEIVVCEFLPSSETAWFLIKIISKIIVEVFRIWILTFHCYGISTTTLWLLGQRKLAEIMLYFHFQTSTVIQREMATATWLLSCLESNSLVPRPIFASNPWKIWEWDLEFW